MAKIEIVSITYRSNGQEFTAKPGNKNEVFGVAGVGFTQCTPGEKRCEGGFVKICCSVAGLSPDWLTSTERC
jgi:hypothetical protein